MSTFPSQGGGERKRGRKIDRISHSGTINPMITPEERQKLNDAAAVFKALSHPVRVQILDLLIPRQLSVSEIAQALSLGQSSASKHLAVMKESGIIIMERQGSQMICSVAIRSADLLLACAREPQKDHRTGVAPVPFRPSCE